MSGKTVGTLAVLVGCALVVIAGGADVIGVGGAPGFGWKQILGVGLGVVAVVVGLVRLRSKRT